VWHLSALCVLSHVVYQVAWSVACNLFLFHLLLAPVSGSRTNTLHAKSPTTYFLDLCVSSLREGHANLLCIVPILTDVTEVTAQIRAEHVQAICIISLQPCQHEAFIARYGWHRNARDRSQERLRSGGPDSRGPPPRPAPPAHGPAPAAACCRWRWRAELSGRGRLLRAGLGICLRLASSLCPLPTRDSVEPCPDADCRTTACFLSKTACM